MNKTNTRTIDVPVDDGHTVKVVGTFFEGQVDGINLILRPDDRQEHGEYGKQQDVSIGQLENIEAVIRAMASMLPAEAHQRVVQPAHSGSRNGWTHFIVGREFVSIHELLRGIDGETHGFTYSCGDAVHELAQGAIQAFDNALRGEDGHDTYELHLGKALMAAIGVLALVGYTAHALQPDGCESGGPNENPFTPTEQDARAYAGLLMDIARERWPAKAEWFKPVNELAAERKDGAT